MLIALGFIVGTILLSLTVWLLARRLSPESVSQETRDLAASIVFRIGALHVLILALVFAENLVKYERLTGSLVEESSLLGDLSYDMRRYGGDSEAEVRALLGEYARGAVDGEWDLLRDERQLSLEVWQVYDRIYELILDLEPETRREEIVQEVMLEKIRRIAQLRQLRDHNSDVASNLLFWIVAIAGVICLSWAFFAYEVNKPNVFLLGLYSGFTGLILFVIWAYTSPFGEPNQISAGPLIELIANDVSYPDF